MATITLPSRTQLSREGPEQKFAKRRAVPTQGAKALYPPTQRLSLIKARFGNFMIQRTTVRPNHARLGAFSSVSFPRRADLRPIELTRKLMTCFRLSPFASTDQETHYSERTAPAGGEPANVHETVVSRPIQLGCNTSLSPTLVHKIYLSERSGGWH